MAKFNSDLTDIYFNLFEYLNIQDLSTEFGTEELWDVVREYHKFCDNELYPCREEGDQVGVKLENGKVTVPPGFKKAKEGFYENGWFGLGLSESLGGIAVPESVYLACTSSSIGANCSFTMYPGLSRAALGAIHKVGSQQQIESILPKIMSGEWGGTMCLTEAGAGSDVGASMSSATPLGDGKYSIKGTKIFISSGDNNLYDNIIHLVLARTPNAPAGVKGLSIFIVPKNNITEDGKSGEFNHVTCTKVEEKMGIHGSATCELTFGDTGECTGQLLGEEGEGIKTMFIVMNEARILTALQGEGQANAAYLMAAQYAKERSQFGKTIDQHPDVKRMLLKMRSISRGMRSLLLYSGPLIEGESKGDAKATRELALLTPICKAYCTDQGFNVTVDALQIHGGYGYCSEYGVEQYCRDVKISTIYEGTNGIQAIDFVTRKLLKDQGAAYKNLLAKITKTISDPRAGQWNAQLALLGKSIQWANKVLEYYTNLAQKNEIDEILVTASDFLTFNGHLILAWLHLEQALLAQESIPKTTDSEKVEYYESKIEDYLVFCRYFLGQNIFLTQSILNFSDDVTKIEV